jgi:hypothetical protein
MRQVRDILGDDLCRDVGVPWGCENWAVQGHAGRLGMRRRGRLQPIRDSATMGRVS